MFRRRQPFDTIAAVDLGSNSFHMIVARVRDGQVHVLDRLRETVRLASGLDHRGNISDEAMERGLACLERFGQRVRELPLGSVRAVGTNTLRKARDAGDFQERAREALGHPIEIIGGREEARLIYLGVAHSLADDGGRRLVVDIGGGSTELIIGERFEPIHMESLHMGCVSMGRWYFPNGEIKTTAWRAAEIAARLELQPIEGHYKRVGWQDSLGASGTLLAVARILREQGWCENGISMDGLRKLREALLKAGHVDRVDLKGLSEDRRPVLPGGMVVLVSIFEALQIEHMRVSDGALREGLVYDLLGRNGHEDVRSRTINGLMKRFQVDEAHALRVEHTSLQLVERVGEEWELDQDDAESLAWAARLHEVGLSISHSQYHKHGAYLVENADLAGFTLQGQQRMALLVRAHRRKFPTKPFEALPARERRVLQRLAILLRMAVLLHRARTDIEVPIQEIRVKDRSLKLRLAEGWLEAHPLTRADLEREAEHLRNAQFKLKFE
ncbi:exopolyphosphatase [Ectothiorhodospira variabilis]|uniref:exopolyphosphatase n=1 Tax=Ectothiorhodospira variabilis TaxID=505694 RepID=UPI001EFADED0|nr:exopolyphosphatase [Ectothiorhodospira variabilis]MCG5494157.1 exopolyphosphatase [Ectothiorhodospira variabilis]MCG5497388.1 exopolyphosphatase [Ectothiorhodospira variabilis]MCG5503313.1 exopolyphosphatase [Ectothiorhodospira variabilis]MCG5506599.1 exopolyphosphatase [Ectothiorhodospira variabilis]